MHPLRSLRNRLALVFGLIVLGAIATVYLTTTPRLQDRLTAQKLDGLEADANRSAPQLADAVRPGADEKAVRHQLRLARSLGLVVSRRKPASTCPRTRSTAPAAAAAGSYPPASSVAARGETSPA